MSGQQFQYVRLISAEGFEFVVRVCRPCGPSRTFPASHFPFAAALLRRIKMLRKRAAIFPTDF